MDLISDLLSFIIPLIPAEYTANILAIVSFIVALANLIRQFWKPPPAGTKAARLYHIIEAIALSKGWNSGAYGPDKKAIMVPLNTKRDEVARLLGLSVDETRPK